MTEQLEALDRLIEAVEAGGDCIGPIAALALAPQQYAECVWAYGEFGVNASLDAAKALHESLLPDLLWEITPLGNCYIRDKSFSAISHAIYPGSPARAWLLAILRAHRSIVGDA